MRVSRRSVALALVGFLVTYAASVPTRILLAARPPTSVEALGPADVALVPGAAVWTARPAPVFAARLDAAAALYRAGRVRMIVTTGARAEGDRVSEAEAAVRYLTVRHGLPVSALRLESVSRTTASNARIAAHLVPRGARVLVVTDPLHAARAVQLARRAGLDAHAAPVAETRVRSFRARARMFARESVLLVIADVSGR